MFGSLKTSTRKGMAMKQKELKQILEEHAKWLVNSSTGKRADLSRVCLHDADLRGNDLSWANFRWADLSGAGLCRADLCRADLRDSTLCDGSLRHANLTDADLRGADLSGADLSGADLSGAHMSLASLNRASLRGAKLLGANLRGADLRGADLTGADIRRIPQRYAVAGGACNNDYIMQVIYSGLKDQTEPLFWCGCCKGITEDEMREHIQERESDTEGLEILKFLLSLKSKEG